MGNEMGFPKEMTERLREKVRNDIAGLLPDEQLDKLVKAELDKLFKPQKMVKKVMDGSYNNRVKETTEREVSLIGQMVEAELRDHALVSVKKAVNDWTEQEWDTRVGDWTSKALAKWLDDNRDEVIRVMVATMMNGAVNSLLGSIQNSLNQAGFQVQL